MWGGSISDKELFLKSGLLEKLEPDDLVLADKGFRIRNAVESKGCKLYTPNYLENKIQFSAEEVGVNKKLSHHRVHVERAIGRIKTFKFFEGQICYRHLDIVNEYFFIAAFLINFGNPLINLKDF